MKMKSLFVLALLTATAYADIHSTLSLRHRESEGVGYNQGYSTADYYLTAQMSKLECLLNLRGHVFNNAKAAGNLGLGFRYALNEDSSRIGTSFYYDFRDTKHFFTHQLGAGLEWLSKNLDLRLNGYAPIGKQKNITTHKYRGFTGNTLLVKKKFTAALPCIEGEIGTQLADPFYFAVGSYYLFRESSQSLHVGNAFGAKARFDVDIGRYVTLGAIATYDPIYKTRVQGYIGLNIPLGPWKEMTDVSCQYEKRRIVRNEIIPIHSKKRSRTPLTLRENTPVQFVFVNNAAQFQGDGSFERPFRTLKEAEAHSKNGDVIYVFPGDGTSRGMDEGIVLKPDQILASSGSDLIIDDVVIPAQTPGELPSIVDHITNPGSNETKEFFYLIPWESSNGLGSIDFATSPTSISTGAYDSPSLSSWISMEHKKKSRRHK